MGVPTRYGARHNVRAAVLAVELHLEFRYCVLVAVGHDTLAYDYLRTLVKHRGGAPGRAIDSAELHRVHLKVGILLEIRVSYRVDPAKPRALARADVLFLIQHLRALLQEKAVYAVVARCLGAVAVNSAACDYRNVGALADEEIVVNQVVNVGMGNACGNVYRFPLSAGLDPDVDSGLVRFGLYRDVFRVLPASAHAVLADIVRALESGHAVVIRNDLQHFRGNFVEAVIHLSHCTHQPFHERQTPQGSAL